MDGDRHDGDLEEFGKKNATQIMIFLPHYTWAENNNNNLIHLVSTEGTTRLNNNRHHTVPPQKTLKGTTKDFERHIARLTKKCH